MVQYIIMGKLLFIILWPLVWFYAPLRVRVRVLVTDGEKALLVKNWFGPRSWQLPGGGMKYGETVLQTAQRELKEEVGIELSEKMFIKLTSQPMAVKQYGLLMRYHYVWVDRNGTSSDLSKKLKSGKDVVAVSWEKLVSHKRIAPEVQTGHSLLQNAIL